MLALFVVLLWGLNFLALRAGLDHFPPMFFAALRFAVLAIPVLIFIPRPDVPVRWLVLYGLGFGVGQFAFLFTAMRLGMPTGLASLVLQSSAPFTVVLGAILLREKLTRVQMIGLAVAVGGMAIIGADRLANATLVPVLLCLAAGLSWAFGNLGARKTPATNPLHVTLWMSVVPPLPLFALSMAIEGPTAGINAFARATHDGHAAFVALAYTVIAATICGSGLWTYLMSRYPAGVVAPFSLLVPIVGFTAAWLVLHEEPSVFSLVGGAIVILGAAAATGVRIPGGRQVSPELARI
ncbi:hypothetical protein GCM10011591_36630 [Nocardia camponoti]|uniref:EamA domain-containing protein n=2 Tax=Nocardia camponoti TaxID=1616106 RepID=A0A917VBX1_9NOCA|nr:hypothetical protein GCM10011591_36630 [Nocardia camponoti]